MEKFSRRPKIKQPDIKTLFNGNYIKVVANDDYEYVDEKDGVIVMPILMPQRDLVLRIEKIPPYYSNGGPEKHITLVSGGIEEGEDPFDTAIRELYEETGIKITNPTWDNYELLDNLFITKMASAKIWFYLFILYPEDYDQVMAQGDGTKWEEESENFKCNVRELTRLQCSDIVTKFGIDLILRNFGG